MQEQVYRGFTITEIPNDNNWQIIKGPGPFPHEREWSLREAKAWVDGFYAGERFAKKKLENK